MFFIIGLALSLTTYCPREATMRMLVLADLAITAFAASQTIERTDANAVVCARGVHRVGCVAPNGAAVAHCHCRYDVVNGVRVRHCI
jgi:hypothetical protein